MVERTPTMRGDEDKRVRNVWSYKARRCLKQARRCEQLAYRIQMLTDPPAAVADGDVHPNRVLENLVEKGARGGRKRRGKDDGIDVEIHQTYGKLNREAMHLILKNIDKNVGWGDDLGGEVVAMQRQGNITVMRVPSIKRAALKYHEEHAKFRRKGIEEHLEKQMALYRHKCKGAWDLLSSYEEGARDPAGGGATQAKRHW